jgi:predicted nucleic acid-binding protein
MKYCADTWFFIELSKQEPKALKIINTLKKSKNILIVPSVVILELTRRAIRTGTKKYVDDLINTMKSVKNILIAECDVDIAEKAGEISAVFNIPSIDSIIAATSIINKCNKLISDDSHFNKLKKSKLIKLVSW